MWAGYLALANQQGEAAGNPPLGFINPALYAIGVSGKLHHRLPRHHQWQQRLHRDRLAMIS